MISRCRVGLVLLFGVTSVALAGVGPISYNDLGFNVPVTTVCETVACTQGGSDPWLSGISGNQSDGTNLPNEQGSNFSGTVNGTATWLYCVDDQRFIDVPSNADNYTANVILLNNIAANASSVSLGNSTDWTNQIAGANSATARYEMAAYLISNFSVSTDGTLTNGLGGTGADVAKNQSIQSAIWALTNNADIGSGGISHITNGTGSDSSLTPNSFWVTQAENNYQAVNTNGWAVISFLPLNDTPSGVQTLIVQVTPEPGYTAAMLLLLGGLLVMRYRRRQV